jgi:hypothetical protein
VLIQAPLYSAIIPSTPVALLFRRVAFVLRRDFGHEESRMSRSKLLRDVSYHKVTCSIDGRPDT